MLMHGLANFKFPLSKTLLSAFHKAVISFLVHIYNWDAFEV